MATLYGTAADGDQLFVPAALAHGFALLEPECEVDWERAAT